MEAALRTRLKNDAGVTAIVGNRIDWDERPQATAYPALVLETVVGIDDQHMQGFTLQETRIQFNCFAADKKTAVALRDAVKAAIAPPATVGGVEFMRAQRIERRQAPRNTNTDFVNREILEATFFHRPTT